MKKDVVLPRELDELAIIDCIAKCVSTHGAPKHKEVSFDFSSVSFVKPTGVTAFANLIRWLLKWGCIVSFVGTQSMTRALKYLDDSQFFKKYLGKTLGICSSIRETTIELAELKADSRHQWVDCVLLPWLNLRLGIDTDGHLPEFRVCIEEVFNNITDHSGEQTACAFAQHYPRLNAIELSISDFGVGIPYNVRKKLQHAIPAPHAIQQAVLEGFSTKSKPTNRGSGLDTLVQNIVTHNQGTVRIISHDGMLDCELVEGRVGYRPFGLAGLYPGTLIKIVLKTDTIPHSPVEHGGFSWDF